MLDRIAYKLRHEQTDKIIFDIYGCFMLLQRFLDLHLTLDVVDFVLVGWNLY